MKTNKIFIILLIFITVILSGNNKIYAVEINSTYSNIEKYNISIPDDVINYVIQNYDTTIYDFWINFWNETKTYDIWLYEKEIYPDLKAYLYDLETSDGVSRLVFNQNFKCKRVLLNYEDMSINKDIYDSNIYSHIYLNRIDCDSSKPLIFYSSFDIYSDNTYNEVFWNPSDLATIIPILGVQEVPTMMKRILKMIIPVSLIVLSVVLVISLIKSVISRMA